MAVCPHCNAPTAQPGSFCVSCGKAMPPEGQSAPRILGTHELASSAAGRSLQMDQLARHIRTGYRTLLAVGILQVVLGLVVAAFASLAPDADRNSLYLVSAFVVGIGVVFLGLSFWSRSSPLPATVTGLVLFVSSWVLDISADPSLAMRGLVIKLAITIFLARAVAAAVKHRALKRQTDQEQPRTAAARTATPAADQYRAAA